MDELQRLYKEEKELRKKLALLNKMKDSSDLYNNKKKLSQYDNKSMLLFDIVWLQSMKRDFPEMFNEMIEMYAMPELVFDCIEEQCECEQLCIPGLEDVIRTKKCHKRKLEWETVIRKSSFEKYNHEVCMKDILLHHDKSTLTNLCKYMMVDIPKKSRYTSKELAEMLTEYICKNPMYIIQAISLTAFNILVSFSNMEYGERMNITEQNVDAYNLLQFWGLLSVEMVSRNGKVEIVLIMSEEVKQHIMPILLQINDCGIAGANVAGYLESAKIYFSEQLYQLYKDILKNIVGILAVYGAMERDELYCMFTKLTGMDIEQQDFYRLVYLLGTAQKKCATGVNKITQQNMVGVDFGTIELVIEKTEQTITTYYSYSNMEEIICRINELFQLWEPVVEVLTQWELLHDELCDRIDEYHNLIIHGVGLDCLLNLIRDEFCMESVVDIACIWRAILWNLLQYPSYVLKGYSRLRAEQEFGLDPYYMMFDDSKKARIVKANLQELPLEVKRQLGDMVQLSQEGNIVALLSQEKNLDGLYRSNPEISTVMTMNLVDAYYHLEATEQTNWLSEVILRVQEWIEQIKDSAERDLMVEWCNKRGVIVDFNQGNIKNTSSSQKLLIGDEDTNSYFWYEQEMQKQPVVKVNKVYPNDASMRQW